MHHVSAPLLALSIDTAKNIAMFIAAGFVALSVISAVLVKKLVTKLVLVVVLVTAALAMWSQRANLQDCAARAKDRVSGSGTTVECTFFGSDVAVP